MGKAELVGVGLDSLGVNRCEGGVILENRLVGGVIPLLRLCRRLVLLS